MELGAPTGRWNMIVIYRGRHCPARTLGAPELPGLHAAAVACRAACALCIAKLVA